MPDAISNVEPCLVAAVMSTFMIRTSFGSFQTEPAARPTQGPKVHSPRPNGPFRRAGGPGAFGSCDPVGMTTPEIRSLLPAAEALLPELVAIRRRLHQRPELGLNLPETQVVVVEELEKLGLRTQSGTRSSSVVAVIEGSAPGPTVLLRADMDALAVAEQTGLEFSSRNAGTMHACGHDAHIAMLLGAARLLVERRASYAGRVLLMFQPGEEGLFGAQVMLDEGLLDAAGMPRPTGAFAIHMFTM